MSVRNLLARFGADRRGAVLPFVLILIPALLLVGGAATDISHLNAQRRYTQSQADLAAQSAARHLPDPVAVRAAARRVVAANPRHGQLVLTDEDILLGSHTPAGGFLRAADQHAASGATAVQVVVRSPFRPILLAPVLSPEDIVVRRRAVAAQKDGAALFMLRNRLVGLDLARSALGPLLGAGGLGLSAGVLSYEGLVNTRIKAEDLLGIVSAGVAVEALTFGEVLRLPVAVPKLLGGLVRLGALPPQSVPQSYPSPFSVTLQDVLAMSPGLAQISAGNILPDVSLSAFEVLSLLAQLKPGAAQRLGTDVGLDINSLLPGLAQGNRLLEITAGVGLIRPPVWVLARPGDTPARTARVEQLSAVISASTLSLLDLRLRTGAALAEARLLTLNCAARRPTDVAAVFEVTTSPVTLGVTLSILRIAEDVAARDMTAVTLGGGTVRVPVTFGQMNQVIPVSTPLNVSSVISGLRSTLTKIRDDVEDRRSQCTGFLAALLCPVRTFVNGVTASLSALLGNVLSTVNTLLTQTLALDSLLAQLQSLLGLTVAGAELVLADLTCDHGLVE